MKNTSRNLQDSPRLNDVSGNLPGEKNDFFIRQLSYDSGMIRMFMVKKPCENKEKNNSDENRM